MKKSITLLLTLLISVCLISCSSFKPESSSSEIQKSESTQTVITQSDLTSETASDTHQSTSNNEASQPISTQSNTPPLDAKCPIAINGISLSYYSIAYDSNDIYSKFSAEILKTYMEQNFGVELNTYADSALQQNYEILIGNTNRNISVENIESLGNNDYALCVKNDKIVLQANGYMIGGAVRGFLDICESTVESNNIRKVIINEKPIVQGYTYKSAKNALLYIGDGMGFNHIEWALNNGMQKFYASDMPNKGSLLTYSYSVAVDGAPYTDSAAAATALATGYKAINGTLGRDANGNNVQNIRELAHASGAKTAVLTTDVITGATPAAFLVHIYSRDLTEEISKNINSLCVSDKVDFAEGSLGNNLFDRSKDVINELGSGNNRFFMMLEEGYIDKYSHNNDKGGMIDAIERFNRTIAYAMEFTLIRGDTILIVTADHETGGVDKSNGFAFTTEEHTNADVPLFAMGKGTEALVSKPLNNVLIPRFIATNVFGAESFGDININS